MEIFRNDVNQAFQNKVQQTGFQFGIKFLTQLNRPEHFSESVFYSIFADLNKDCFDNARMHRVLFAHC